MGKKHRDIVVDGQQYGWIASYWGKDIDVKVFKDKKKYFTQSVRMTTILPSDIEGMIKEYNEKLSAIELREILDKEWSEFLKGVPWDGYGSTIAESNKIFNSKRRKWTQKMAKKHGTSAALLLLRYGSTES